MKSKKLIVRELAYFWSFTKDFEDVRSLLLSLFTFDFFEKLLWLGGLQQFSISRSNGPKSVSVLLFHHTSMNVMRTKLIPATSVKGLGKQNTVWRHSKRNFKTEPTLCWVLGLSGHSLVLTLIRQECMGRCLWWTRGRWKYRPPLGSNRRNNGRVSMPTSGTSSSLPTRSFRLTGWPPCRTDVGRKRLRNECERV